MGPIPTILKEFFHIRDNENKQDILGWNTS